MSFDKFIQALKAKASNKTQTLAPKPFIDKLSLVLTPDEKLGKQLHGLIYQAFSDDASFYQHAGKPLKGYQRAAFLGLKGVVDRPRLDYRFTKATSSSPALATSLRLDMNPSKVGKLGLEELKAVSELWFDGGWQTFVTQANVSRIDIAVDLPTLRMDQFLHLPNQAATVMLWKMHVSGHPETIVHGSHHGHETRIYNKKKEQLAKHKPWSGKSVVRVERSLRNPKIKGVDVPSIPNPFVAIVLTTALPPPPDPKEEMLWAMFSDSVSVRGLESALALLRPAKRSAFRKYLKTHQHGSWDAEAIWKGWTSHLEAIGW